LGLLRSLRASDRCLLLECGSLLGLLLLKLARTEIRLAATSGYRCVHFPEAGFVRIMFGQFLFDLVVEIGRTLH
jgi:hypothetical protein